MTDLSPPHIKNLRTSIPAPLISKVNAPSAIKEQLLKKTKQLFSELSYYPPLELSFVTNLKNSKQILINNGFPNYIVDTEIKQFIYEPEQPNIDNNLNHKQTITQYNKNQFHSNYKIDEQIDEQKLHPSKFSPY